SGRNLAIRLCIPQSLIWQEAAAPKRCTASGSNADQIANIQNASERPKHSESGLEFSDLLGCGRAHSLRSCGQCSICGSPATSNTTRATSPRVSTNNMLIGGSNTSLFMRSANIAQSQ